MLRGMQPAKAAITLRKAFDTVIEAAMAAKENLSASKRTAATRGSENNSSGRSSRVMLGSASGKSLGGRPSTTRGSSPASSANVSRSASAASKNFPKAAAAATPAAEDAPAAAAAAAALASNPSDTTVSTSDAGGASGVGVEEAPPDNSVIASLKRQLEALSARQNEADVATALATAMAGEGGPEEGGNGGKSTAGPSRLEAATHRCAELEDKIEDLEGESLPLFSLRLLFSWTFRGSGLTRPDLTRPDP